MFKNISFNRLELSGSLGDLGTLLPIAIAMILVNGLNAVGVFFSIGLFYILSGLFFKVTVPVQPMKVIGAYAIATAMNPTQIIASSMLMSVFLLLIGLTGAINGIRSIVPTPVIRGVQFSTGAMLISGGIKFILGSSNFQELQGAAEPFLAFQHVGPIAIGLVIGIAGGIITFLLLDNKKIPAGLTVVIGGMLTGWFLGARIELNINDIGINLPQIMPFGLPKSVDFTFALFVLVIPQLPMTLGNAVLAYTDLSHKYFGKNASKVSNRNACVSMAFANILSSLIGGMPLCHGAGGLAAHYRFGARTAGSNLMIGTIFMAATLLFGDKVVELFKILPMSILGILLVFSGAQLTMTIIDLETRKDFFVVSMIIGVTLASNLAAGFIVGVLVAQLLKWEKISV